MNVKQGFKKGGYASGQCCPQCVVDSVPGGSGQHGSHPMLVKELAEVKELDLVEMMDP